MSKLKYIFFVVLLCLVSANTSAKKRVFYDSKSNLSGIAGDYMSLSRENKFFPIVVNIDIPRLSDPKELEKFLNDNNYGKAMLDYLFLYHDGKLSDEGLKQLAMHNILLADREKAQVGLIGAENILKEDYLPILKNCFVFVTVPKKKGGSKMNRWMVFKAQIDEETLNEVYNCWNDSARYNQIKVPMKFVESGKCKFEFAESNVNAKTRRRISRKVPELAIRGQVINRSPFMTNIGTNNGLSNSTNVAIYRAKEKHGKMYSTRVSTTKVCALTDSTACLYTFAGGQASYKKGDVAVYEPCRNTSLAVTGNYMDHSYGINLTFDRRLKLSKSGMSQYFMMMAGVGGYEKMNKRLYATNNGAVVYSPTLFDLGLGYGVGFEIAHSLELQPYIMGQAECAYFKNKMKSVNDEKTGNLDDDNRKYDKDATSFSVRMPVGLRLNVNIVYPLQLVLGAEYIVNFKISKDDKETINDPQKFFFDPTGYKRDGLNLYGGLRFNF